MTGWPALTALLVLALAGPSPRADELTGTPYTITWRGAASVAAQEYARRSQPTWPPRRGPQTPAGNASLLRLFDLVARRELARTTFDDRLGGWMFQLPTSSGRAGTRCLALIDLSNRPLLIREPTPLDNGAQFRNPLWEQVQERSAELDGLRHKRAGVEGGARAASQEAQKLRSELALPPSGEAADCPTPPPPPDPLRPAAALEPRQAQAASGAVCALRWERDHGTGIDLGRIFADAGLDADWRARTGASALLDAWASLRVPVSRAEVALVRDSARRGKAFLEHADAVRTLQHAQARCRAEAARLAQQATASWHADVENTRAQPERARGQCVRALARLADLNQSLVAASAFIDEIDRRMAELAAPPASVEPMDLGAVGCSP